MKKNRKNYKFMTRTIIKKIPWALVISVLALSITLLHLLNVIPQKECSIDNHNDILGVLISSVALVVSLYFIVLGIRGHQLQDEIQNKEKEFKNAIDTTLIKPATQVSETHYNLYSQSIELLTIINNHLPNPTSQQKDYLYELKMAQARFAINSDYFDDKEKIITSINLLGEKSKDTNDIDLLKKVITTPKNNDEDIREAAFKAYHRVFKRLEK